MKKAFVTFLKRYKVYGKFIHNLKHHRNEDPLTIDQFIASIVKNPDSLIIAGFVWNDTPEHHLFWSDLSREWELNYHKWIKISENGLYTYCSLCGNIINNIEP